MKASQIVKGTVLLMVFGAFATTAFAGSRRYQVRSDERSSDNYEYVMVTGSHIPQKVRVKYVGNLGYADLRVYSRHEIDRTGRPTVEGVLSTDPSLQVRMNNATGN
jgi:hypothetical protein